MTDTAHEVEARLDLPLELLTGSPEALEAFPVGSRSADGLAAVGSDGWLFLCDDTNDVAQQIKGELPLTPTALDQWQRLLTHHRTEADRLGVGVAGLVVPDKSCLHGTHHQPQLTPCERRPVLELLERCGRDLVYPLAALADAAPAGRVFRQGDTHVSPRGADVLLASVLDAFSTPTPPSAVNIPTRTVAITGDLGMRFDPPLMELVDVPVQPVTMHLLSDNADAILAQGGHFGITRVVRNPAAIDARTLVVFGASHCFPSPGDPAGLAAGLSRCFRDVHFIWAPFAWDSRYIAAAGADLVLLQTTERYLIRPPELRVDVAAFASRPAPGRRPRWGLRPRLARRAASRTRR